MNLGPTDRRRSTPKPPEKGGGLLQRSGPETSKFLFNYLEPGQNPHYPEGRQDDTHFSELGARRMAELVLHDIKEQHLELADYIGKGIAGDAAQIDPRPFADNAGHWYGIFDKKNIINPLPGDATNRGHRWLLDEIRLAVSRRRAFATSSTLNGAAGMTIRKRAWGKGALP